MCIRNNLLLSVIKQHGNHWLLKNNNVLSLCTHTPVMYTVSEQYQIEKIESRKRNHAKVDLNNPQPTQQSSVE